MGVVYRAMDEHLRRAVAIKTLLAGQERDVETRERFRREAEAAARLRHPGIVAVHEVGAADDGAPFMVMDLVEGASLAARLAERRVPLEEAARIVRDVARAVEHAHAQGVVHRDLKPQNVMVDAAGQALVMDFGLAKLLDATQLTREGAMLGTAAYMPPEQVDGIDVDARSDVYSLGATLYHALTGRPPFEANGHVALVNAVLTKEPVPPSRVDGRVPGDLETICLRALEKEPARRYASAAALADDLQRFLDGEPIAARPLGRIGRLARRARRNKLVTGLVLAAALALLTGVLLAAQQALERRAEQRAAEARERERLTAEAAREREHTARLEVALDQAQREKARADRTLARVLHERGVAAQLDGRGRDAAIYAATALSEGERAGASARELTDYRATWLSAREGSWRAPVELLRLGRTRVSTCVASSDGRWVALISARAAAVWDAVTRTTRPLPAPGNVWTFAAAIGPAGALYLGMRTGVQVIDLATGAVRRTIATDEFPRGLAASLDGRWLALGLRDRGVGLIDLAQAGPVRELGPVATQPSESTPELAWTPGGKLLHSVRGASAFDVGTGELEVVDPDPNVIAVAASPDGDIATGSSEGWVRISAKDEAGVTALTTVLRHPSPVLQLAFSTDGRLLATRGQDSRVMVWTPGGEHVATFTFDARPLALAFLADRHLAVSTADGVVWSHDLTGASTLRHSQAVLAVSCSPDGSLVASACADKTVFLWDATRERSPTNAIVTTWSSGVREVLVEDSGHVVAGLQDGKIARVDLERKEVVYLGAHRSPVRELALAGPDRLLSGALELCSWDLSGSDSSSRGREPRWVARHPHYVTGIAVDHARGRVATAGHEGTARTWDLDSGAAGPVLVGASRLTALGSLGDGRFVVGDANGELRVWDPDDPTPPTALQAHDGVLQDLDVSATGDRLATAGGDGIVRLWTVEPLEVIAELRRHDGPVRAVTFSPDGRWLISAGEDRAVRWWSLPLLFDATQTPADVLREAQEGTGLVIHVERGDVDPSPRRAGDLAPSLRPPSGSR
jgi:WD40 repeat protein